MSPVCRIFTSQSCSTTELKERRKAESDPFGFFQEIRLFRKNDFRLIHTLQTFIKLLNAREMESGRVTR